MNGNYLGFCDLEETLVLAIPIEGQDGSPCDPAAAPVARIYQGNTLITTATLTKLDTGTVTGATNVSPIVITGGTHGLETGNRVQIASVGGNTEANGQFTITKVNTTTFSLDGSTGNGGYTTGGTWHVAGLYQISLDVLSSNSFESGVTYEVLISWLDGSSNAVQAMYAFTVT